MNRTQQSTAIAICLLGLAVLALGAVFLVREWREEVAARERLEEENAQLRVEIERLKVQSRMPRFFLEGADLKLTGGDGPAAAGGEGPATPSEQ